MSMVTLVVMVVMVCVALLLLSPSETFQAAGDTIFVSVASYRDAQCEATLRDLFAKADHPSRVFVGVCEQNSEDPTEKCELPTSTKRPVRDDQVRRVRIPHTKAKGPTYARYLCSTLYRDETWFMQIDSHTKFAKGWDTLAINNVKKCPSNSAILTHYPRVMEDYGKSDRGVPVLCKSTFDGHGVPTFEAVILAPKSDGTPRPVPFVSGGFVFGPGRMVKDVPFDPSLDYLFQGEEILHSARLWTAGYDFYTPLDNVVFHQYERKGAPRFWNDIPTYAEAQNATLRKVRRLLGLDGPILKGYKYGLGSKRTIDEYWAFARIDPTTKTSKSQATFCAG